MNQPYKEVLAKVTAASAAFREVQRQYRAREIGDHEYLAARKVYEAAQHEFDVREARRHSHEDHPIHHTQRAVRCLYRFWANIYLANHPLDVVGSRIGG